MSEYTSEQVEVLSERDWLAKDVRKALCDYAALLRERESAKAVVTDDVVHEAIEAYVISDKAAGVPRFDAFKVALEAVAPMLASAHVNQEPYCYTVEQKNGLSQGAMCRTKVECEASPLFDPENDHVIPLYREPVLASARVLDAMVLVPRTDVENLLKLTTFNTSSLAATFSEWAEKMLAAAPKPEVSERHHWLCCGALKPDHSDKPRVMPDCFDSERHVWAVSPKPETEE